MTKKDYELIAKSFNTIIDHYTRLKLDNREHQIVQDLIDNLSVSLKMNNPRFDGNKFKKACGTKMLWENY